MAPVTRLEVIPKTVALIWSRSGNGLLPMHCLNQLWIDYFQFDTEQNVSEIWTKFLTFSLMGLCFRILFRLQGLLCPFFIVCSMLPSMYTVLHEAIKISYFIHYHDVIMGAMASQITSLTIAYSTVYSVEDQIKNQSSASLAFVRGIHRRPVNSPHKGPVTQKMFPFDDVIMSVL